MMSNHSTFENRWEKITIVHAVQTTVYVNGNRVIEGSNLFLDQVLRVLGFEVNRITIDCHDMPKIHGHPRDYSSYEKLSDLLSDREKLLRKERKEKIASLYSELTRLEELERDEG